MTIAPSVGGLLAKGSNPSGGNDTRIKIWGLWHFLIASMGTTVSVQIIGQDCGDFTVAADGSITVPIYGTTISSVPGVVTIANLIAADGLYNMEQATPLEIQSGSVVKYLNVPMVIGRGFVAQGQRLRAATADDIKSPSGPALGKLRRTHEFSALIADAVVVSFGTKLTPTPTGNMIEADDLLDGHETGTTINVTAGAGFSGVYRGTLTATYDFDDQFCWQVDRPWPFAIMAVTSFLKATDRDEKA